LESTNEDVNDAYPSMKVDELLAKRIVKTIQKRCKLSESDPTMEAKPLENKDKMSRMASIDLAKTEELRRDQILSRGRAGLQKNDVLGYHSMMKKTRSDRMLDNYDRYSQIWQKNMSQQRQARDQLRGSMNKVQRKRDMTLYERLDEDHLKKAEVKNLLDKTFKETECRQPSQAWAHKLR
jgi:hypothetical protein